MIKLNRFIYIGLLLLILSLIITLLPASWVVKQLLVSPSKVQWSSVSGYWWQGKISQLQLTTRGYRLALGDVHWRYDWRSISEGKACVIFSQYSTNIQSDGQLCYEHDVNHIVFNKTSINVNAHELAQLMGVEVRGDLDGYLHYAQVSPAAIVAVDGDVAWQYAEIHNGEKWIGLQELLLTITTDVDSNRIEARIVDIDSPIIMDLVVAFTTNKMESIRGYIEPRSSVDASLSQTLEFFSQRQSGNRYFFE